MALDGILLRALTGELAEVLKDGRLNKIRQPEKDGLDLVFRTPEGARRLLVSANPSLPLLTLSDEETESPLTAPNICMVLRKHLLNAKLLSVSQIKLERVVLFTFEHLDEMGDLSEKRLFVELMGKYSNIILVDRENKVIDAIRRVPPTMSSVRTVLPGSPYFIPETQGKTDAFSCDETRLFQTADDLSLTDLFAKRFSGFSESASSEFLLSEGFDPEARVSSLDQTRKDALYSAFSRLLSRIESGRFSPEIAYQNGVPKQFSALPLISYRRSIDRYTVEACASVSELLTRFYRQKAETENRKRNAEDLLRIVKTHLERASRKQALQEKQLRDTEDRGRHRLFGELLQAYAYSLPAGEAEVEVQNYHDNDQIVRIPLDPDLSINDNAVRYFDKYNKEKRTFEAVTAQLKETEREIAHLSSVRLSIELSETPEEFREIRRELRGSGYLKHSEPQRGQVRRAAPSKPVKYVSSDGFDLYVGRNNQQNDELTMRFAGPEDWFFHVKNAPGSHVILKTFGREVPDRAFEEAASLAVYYSSLRDAEKAEVDYVLKRFVKKPAGAAPGYVIYHTNYSMMASPKCPEDAGSR